ncbi:bifunctional transcriptional activator/DNA repair enzyme protein Ada, partial [Pseudomonas syringae]
MALTGAGVSTHKAGSTMDSTERTQPARAPRTEDEPRWAHVVTVRSHAGAAVARGARTTAAHCNPGTALR